MNEKNIVAVIALVASATIVGCAQLDTGALAKTGVTAGVSAASAGKGGNKAGTAVAAGAVGVGAASAIAASRTEAKSSGTQTQSSTSAQGGTQPTAIQTTVATQSKPAAASAQPKPQTPPANKPQYTVAQYRAAFAKKTPEQIAAYLLAIYKLSSEQEKRQGFNFNTAMNAVPLKAAFGVALAFGQAKQAWMTVDLLEGVWPQLKTLNSQEDIKEMISTLPALAKIAEKDEKRYMTYDHEADRRLNDFDFQKVLIDKITDPAVADYMLSLDPVINSANLPTLVAKLSDAKKSELYDAAMKRASERKDRIVMEGYYLDMPVLDMAILNWRNGFDKEMKIRGKMKKPIWWQYNSIGALSKQVITQLRFENKAWMKFMDCSDEDALRQFIHQYVDKKAGRVSALTKEEKLQEQLVGTLKGIESFAEEHEGEIHAHDVHKNSRMGTKISYCGATGLITFLEF